VEARDEDAPTQRFEPVGPTPPPLGELPAGTSSARSEQAGLEASRVGENAAGDDGQPTCGGTNGGAAARRTVGGDAGMFPSM
jgi:hypothetical protein